ncbi:MAG TPA: hypothetical protein VKB50_27335 [Vicinamibacterales bacterium]|nr:hypothetical protein [Vicinamibacterales bacterium]
MGPKAFALSAPSSAQRSSRDDGEACPADLPAGRESRAGAAVMQWEFEPAIIDGEAVLCILTATVAFSLD